VPPYFALSAAGVTEIVAGNTLPTAIFWSVRLRVFRPAGTRKVLERLVEAGQSEREHSGRKVRLFDVAVERFGGAKSYERRSMSAPNRALDWPVRRAVFHQASG